MIKFNNVFKSFGEKKVLAGVNFDVRKGEIVFLLGTSGTGKSVTLKLIVGLLKSDAGEIWVDNENVTGFSEPEFYHIRRKCGMIFQHPALFDSLNIYENVAFGLRRLSLNKNTKMGANESQLDEGEIKARVKKYLELVHVKNVEAKRPNEISFGMQKRISLARTLATMPGILLFDEPTTGLDPISTQAINQLIRDLSHELNTTSLVVSHDMNCALAIADRIIVLDQGEVVACGTAKEIISSKHPLVSDFMLGVSHG